ARGRHAADHQSISRKAADLQRAVEDRDLRRRVDVRPLPRAPHPDVVARGELLGGERAPLEQARVAALLGDPALARGADFHLLHGARAGARDRARPGEGNDVRRARSAGRVALGLSPVRYSFAWRRTKASSTVMPSPGRSGIAT